MTKVGGLPAQATVLTGLVGLFVEESDPALDGPLDRGVARGLVVRRSPSLAPHRPRAEPETRLGCYETRRGPDVSPGPRAHYIRTLRSGRSAPARSSR